MTEPNDMLERVIETLREPVRIDRAVDRRVMDEIAGLPAHEKTASGVRAVVEWLRRPRTIRVSPLGGLAMAASLAAVAFAASRLVSPGSPPFAEPSAVRSAPNESVIQFVLVAPEAASVSVVGDFNDWDLAATPLVQSQGGGVFIQQHQGACHRIGDTIGMPHQVRQYFCEIEGGIDDGDYLDGDSQFLTADGFIDIEKAVLFF